MVLLSFVKRQRVFFLAHSITGLLISRYLVLFSHKNKKCQITRNFPLQMDDFGDGAMGGGSGDLAEFGLTDDDLVEAHRDRSRTFLCLFCFYSDQLGSKKIILIMQM